MHNIDWNMKSENRHSTILFLFRSEAFTQFWMIKKKWRKSYTRELCHAFNIKHWKLVQQQDHTDQMLIECVTLLMVLTDEL